MHVERALAILDEVSAFEFGRLDDLLAGIAAPAMVMSERGVVAAAMKVLPRPLYDFLFARAGRKPRNSTSASRTVVLLCLGATFM